MNCLLKMFAAGMLATFSLSAMATDASATPGNTGEQRVEGHQKTQGNLINTTTLQQRIEIRKKTKAHWRDPPTGDRASRLKAKHERTDKNDPASAPASEATRTAK